MTETVVETERLDLVLESTEAVLARIEGMSPADRAEVSPVWLARLRAAAASDPWTHGFAMLERAGGAIVGSCGYKGPPDEDGVVEIAYGVDPDYGGRGYATEAAGALVAFAFRSGSVRLVRAHTQSDNDASARVLTKCGFACAGEVVDPEDGLVWRWEQRHEPPGTLPQSTMRTDVETFMKAWQDAWFTKNGDAIAQMMSDDYIYVAPNGAVMDRASILGVVRDPTYALTSGAHTETVVSMLGEVGAMVRRRWQGSGTFRGQTFVEDHRCVTVCDRSSGQWRIRFEQCSAVA